MAQMGNMVRYVSRSVIVGVAAGAGVLIAAGQLRHFLGISDIERSAWPGVVEALHDLIGGQGAHPERFTAPLPAPRGDRLK